ncbi:MAG: hypothetical protein ACI8UD_003770, partial [Planctomycetota bacterium]
ANLAITAQAQAEQDFVADTPRADGLAFVEAAQQVLRCRKVCDANAAAGLR